LPGGAVVKNMPPNVGDKGDMGSVPGLGRSPGGKCRLLFFIFLDIKTKQ